MPQTDLNAYIPFFLTFSTLFFVTFGFVGSWFIKFWSFNVSSFALGYIKNVCKNLISSSAVVVHSKYKIFGFSLLSLNSDPLAQFFLETCKFVSFYNFDNYLTFLNIVCFLYAPLVVCFFGFFFLLNLFIILNFSYLIPTALYLSFSAVFNVVRSVVRENLSTFATRYTALLDLIFYTILFFNLLGLIPYSFTITSQLSFTLFISTSFFIAINIIGIRVKGIELFSLFLPSGVPILIGPFLVLIEVVSYFARLFSLGIRLFANMMAGHALTIILSGYSWSFLLNQLPVGIISVLVIYCVIGLEFMVAFLQAYVFTMLISIYINDVLSGH